MIARIAGKRADGLTEALSHRGQIGGLSLVIRTISRLLAAELRFTRIFE